MVLKCSGKLGNETQLNNVEVGASYGTRHGSTNKDRLTTKYADCGGLSTRYEVKAWYWNSCDRRVFIEETGWRQNTGSVGGKRKEERGKRKDGERTRAQHTLA